MPPVTRSAARRRVADGEWEEFCRKDFNKRRPRKFKATRAPAISRVSKSSPTSSKQRRSKTTTPSPQRPQTKPHGEQCLPTQGSPAPGRTIAPHFKVIDWKAPNSVAKPSLQWSPMSSSATPPVFWQEPQPSTHTVVPVNPITETASPLPLFRKPAKPFLKSKTNFSHSQTSSSASIRQVTNLKKLDIKATSPNSERAPCTSPSCPIHPLVHNQGTYLHEGRSPRNHFTFGWSNPPAEVWAANQKNRHDEATEADLELIASFRAYHDQSVQAGGVIAAGIINSEPEIRPKPSFIF